MTFRAIAAAIAALAAGATASEAATTLNWSIVDTVSGASAGGHIVFDTTGHDVSAVDVYLDSIADIPNLVVVPGQTGVYTDTVDGYTLTLPYDFSAIPGFIGYNLFDIGTDGSYISGGFSALINDYIALNLMYPYGTHFDISGSVNVVSDRAIFTPSSSAPEPATWAMIVGGFGLLGSALRRRPNVAVSFA